MNIVRVYFGNVLLGRVAVVGVFVGLGLWIAGASLQAAESAGESSDDGLSSADTESDGSSDSGGASEDEDELPPGLDPSVIQKVINSHMPAIKYCYNRELRKEPGLSGKVVVGFTITPKGKVEKAAVRKSTLNNKEVQSCMLDEIKGWSFPEPRGEVSVPINYPFKFKSSY